LGKYFNTTTNRCTFCDPGTYADGINAAGFSDKNLRIACTSCPGAEISLQGASKKTDCFAKFQVAEQNYPLFCYGNGLDTQAETAVDNKDESVFALSRVGADDTDPATVCKEAVNLVLVNSGTTFIEPADLKCDPDVHPKANKDECDETAKLFGGDDTFCQIKTNIDIGTLNGHPKYLCRDENCKGADRGGTCWDPATNKEGTSPPFGCVYDSEKEVAMYYSEANARQFYDGFAYKPICEKYICPPNPADDFERPVPLTEAQILADTTSIPKCALSERGVKAYDDASAKKNKEFVKLFITFTFLAMVIAYFYLKCKDQDLKLYKKDASCLGFSLTKECKWILFGVGMRLFDMQTDWGFYFINVRDPGFEADYEHEDDGDYAAKVIFPASLKQFQLASFVVCILGSILTPMDIWGNRQRTRNDHKVAMSISLLILLLEDAPQLLMVLKFMFIKGVVFEIISILSLSGSIFNIVYNLIVLVGERCDGNTPGLPCHCCGEEAQRQIHELRAEADRKDQHLTLTRNALTREINENENMRVMTLNNKVTTKKGRKGKNKQGGKYTSQSKEQANETPV
jgi:hypothetical protein